jgi:hypothetical protein
MGRKTDLIRAELAVAELEEALVAAKTVGKPTPDELNKLKQDLRYARKDFRGLRGPAGVAVTPATVAAKAKTN